MLDIVNAICGPAATNAPHTMRLSLATVMPCSALPMNGQRLWGGRLPQMISYVMDAESKVPAFHHTAMIAISACVLFQE